MDTDHADDGDLAILRAVLEHETPVGWEVVHAFEAEHGVVLPEPYRTSVAEIGDGSEQMLTPLGKLPRDWSDHHRVRDPAKPFPLTKAWLWEDDPLYAEPGQLPDSLMDRMNAVWENGSLVLAYDGCGIYWALIVTGAHRGHIWNLCAEGAQPFGSEFGYTTGRSGLAGWLKHSADGKWWWDA